jgi:hypothetical protein
VVNEQRKAALNDQKVLNGIAAQQAILNATPDFWEKMRNYGREKSILSDRDLNILNISSKARETGRMPTDRQCDVLLQAYARLQEEGFPNDIAR